MPWKPAHRCAEPGCPALTHRPRCPVHEAMKNRERPSPSLRGHAGAAYWRLRAQVLREEPICQICGVAPATTLDYIIPFSKGGPMVRENSRSACSPCNGSKGAR